MNETKMIEVLARIEDEKEAFSKQEPGAIGFNMDHWFSVGDCGTTACLAGHAALMEGYLPCTSDTCNLPGGEAQIVDEVGAEILGLNDDEAEFVFYLNDIDGVYRWVARKMGVDTQVLTDKVQAARK